MFCFLYVSPEGSTVYNEETGYNGIEIFESKLFEIIQKYPEASILLACDFNVRCGELQDVLLNDDVDFMFQDDTVMILIPLKYQENRKIMRKIILASLIELCKSYSIHILNGRFPGDAEGEITCISNQALSIIL